MEHQITSFRKILFYSILVTYLVILAGSIVRSTGSGMGCPDWPKCFGQYVPPTDISELPTNYKEIFKVQGKEIADFNPIHTWVEYINRLLGVLMGFLVLGVMIFAFRLKKEFRNILFFSIVIFITTLFQAWLGAKVVSSNLAPVKITLHMIFALLILASLIFQYHITSPERNIQQVQNGKLKKTIFLVLICIVLQILIGTQVRQQIDEIANKLGEFQRENWVQELNWIFGVHKLLAAALVGSCFFLYYLINENLKSNKLINILNSLIISVVLLTFFMGIVLNYLGMPNYIQPIHMLLSSILFGLVFRLYLLIS